MKVDVGAKSWLYWTANGERFNWSLGLAVEVCCAWKPAGTFLVLLIVSAWWMYCTAIYYTCLWGKPLLGRKYKLLGTSYAASPKSLKLWGSSWLQTQKLNKHSFPCSFMQCCELFLKCLKPKLFSAWGQAPAHSRPSFMIYTSAVMEVLLRTLTRSQAEAVQQKQ